MRISDWSSDVCSSDLDHPAPAHDRIGGDQSCLRQHLAQTVEREEAHAFLDRNRLGGKFAVFQETRDDRERILILLPDAYFSGHRERFMDRRLLDRKSTRLNSSN